MSLKHGTQWLIDVMGNCGKRSAEAGNLLVRIKRIGIECVAKPECPGQCGSHLPGVLRVQVKIEEVEWLIDRKGKRLGCGGSDAVNELRQSRVRHGRHGSLAKVKVIEAKDPGVGSKPQFVSAVAPGKIVIDEEPRRPPSLNPVVIESADGGKGRIAAASLQDGLESRECLLEVPGTEKAFIPGKCRVEIVHQVL